VKTSVLKVNRRLHSDSLLACLFGIAILSLSAAAQTTAPNEWTWVGGSNTASQSGMYGLRASFAADNRPGGRDAAASWTDASGNYWLFGGVGIDASGGEAAYLNDLWEFNPVTKQWAWMTGSTLAGINFGQSGTYGTKGVPDEANTPGSRSCAASWVDSSGNLWLFGGSGFDARGHYYGTLNDLWRYNPSTNEWTWMSGSNYETIVNGGLGQVGVYGTLGTPDAGNVPGSRCGAMNWIDSGDNLWLFGGQGYDSSRQGFLNDLWEFNSGTNQWAWMGGSSTVNQSGIFGTLGTPVAGNTPGGREGGVNWLDSSGNVWLFGGTGLDATGAIGNLNDFWKFDPSAKEWVWIGGSSAIGTCTVPGGGCSSPGVYGALGVPAAGNIPPGRGGAVGWIDNRGNLWLFSGDGNGSDGYDREFNDLWKFTPSTGLWVWMSGGDTISGCSDLGRCANPAVYGTLGLPSAGNVPGGRDGATIWADQSGNLRFFGGYGIDIDGRFGELNDIWEYQTFVPPPPAATPTFSLASGTYTTVQTVTLDDQTAGATICFTTDGVTTPTVNSTQYSGAIAVSSTETIQAIAVAANYANSAVASATYAINLPPTFTIAGTAVAIVAGATSGNFSTIAIAPVRGFTGNVALTAAITSNPLGATQLPTLSFGLTTPASIAGETAGSATLTIATTSSNTGECVSQSRRPHGALWYGGSGALLVCVLLCGIPGRGRRLRSMVGMFLLLAVLVVGGQACGKGHSSNVCPMNIVPGTTAGAYTITVTGISGPTTATGTIALTIQ